MHLALLQKKWIVSLLTIVAVIAIACGDSATATPPPTATSTPASTVDPTELESYMDAITGFRDGKRRAPNLGRGNTRRRSRLEHPRRLGNFPAEGGNSGAIGGITKGGRTAGRGCISTRKVSFSLRRCSDFRIPYCRSARSRRPGFQRRRRPCRPSGVGCSTIKPPL